MSDAIKSGAARPPALPAAIGSLLLVALSTATPARAADEAKAGNESPSGNGTLEERIRVLERRLELQDEEASAKAKEAASVSASTSGFGLKSASGDYSLNLRLLAQADGRYYLGSPAAPAGSAATTRDGFLFRRIEPTLSGSLGKFVGYNLTLRVDGDRSDNAALVQDVYVDLKFHPLATLRVGKWKEPLALENLESSSALPFIERGYPTALTGNRDLGIALYGNAFDSRLYYTVGVFNGAPDGSDALSTDRDGRKEFVGRIFAEPFKNEYGLLRGLGFGVAGSVGSKTREAATPSYNSAGQLAVFRYRSTTVDAGRQTRFVPQTYFYRNAFGFLAEYAQSRQELANGANAPITVGNEAYELTATYVLSGEDASYGGVKPRAPFTLGKPGFGAFELALRNGVLRLDERALNGGASSLADPATSVKRARTYAIGLNWYLTQNVKLVSDFNFTSFQGGAAGGRDRRDERALFTRAQLSF